jgi:predicted ferric reductase
MTVASIGTSSPALWYFVRATGLVDLVLLTAAMVLGVAEVARYSTTASPRFFWAALHRNLSLLALVFLVLHVVTSVLDTYVSIGVVAAFVPFVGSYHPFWLGLGAVALDLMVALTLTSALRGRIGRRSWRVLHWTAYACWPIAVAHGLGMGTDRAVTWVDGLNACCVAAVVAAVAWRLSATSRGLSRPGRPVVTVMHSFRRAGR